MSKSHFNITITKKNNKKRTQIKSICIMSNDISIESLIEQGKEILNGITYVPSAPGVIRPFPVHKLVDVSVYERWKNITFRYLSLNYPGDMSIPDFRKAMEDFEKHYYSPTEMRKMIGIMESLAILPSKKSFNKEDKGNTSKTLSDSEKTPVVLISHSQKDKEFVLALVTLLENMGLNEKNLFCSSIREYGIPLSGDIFDTIRNLFLNHELYVIFVHSPHYYESIVSLNEMGAAWVLKTDFCSLLTKDMSFDKMNGVVNNSNISIKIDTDDAPSLLNDLYKHLTDIFSLKKMNDNKWERYRNQFLQIVRNL